MRVPRQISPAARARRAWLLDVLVALALTIAALLVTAGVGIAGFAGLLVAIVLGAWVAIEKAGRAWALSRRRRRLTR